MARSIHKLDPSHPVYTLSQAAEYLHVTPKTLRRWIAAGTLRAYRYGSTGRIIRIDHADLEKLRRPVTSLEVA